MKVAALGLLAVVGEIILIRSGVAAYIHAGLPEELATVPRDFLPLFGAARAFIHGQSATPWYGTDSGLVYAPPYAVVLSPLGLLPAAVALGIARLAALGCEAAALAIWASESRQRRGLTFVLLLTIPATQLVLLGQLMAASGLFALTVAVWAQRRDRWLCAGAALAFGFIRISNALPVAGMLIVVASARRGDLARLSGGFAVVLVPLSGIAFAWDGHWIKDFLLNIQEFRLSGPLHLVQLSYGTAGVAALTAVNCAACAYITRRDRGRAIDLDRAAAVMALSVLTATLAGMYAAVFALPALVRMGTRPGTRTVPMVFAFGGWVAILAMIPLLFGGAPGTALSYLDTVAPIVFVAAAYPLLLTERQPSPSKLAAAGT
ncbi:MAG: hypothetical protein ABR573_10420 [Candidatus Dormibacteria bacterium]